MARIILNKIEIDYHENRTYKDEADKRSQQFREIAKVINENMKILEDWINEIGEYTGFNEFKK